MMQPESTEQNLPLTLASIEGMPVEEKLRLMDNIGERLSGLLSINTQVLNKYQTAVGEYLGNFMKSPSYHRQDIMGKKPSSPESLNDYQKMTHTLHNLYRHEFPRRLNIKLDEEALKPETRQLIEDTRKCLVKYRSAIKDVQKRIKQDTLDVTDYKDPSITKIQDEASALARKLKASELADRNGLIPITIDGTPKRISNAKNVGLVLFSFSIASTQFVDRQKVPRPISDFFRDHLDVANSIPGRIQSSLSPDETASEQFKKAYASLLPDTIKAIHEGAHPLQMLSLLKASSQFSNTTQASVKLLNITGLPLMPTQIESDEEAALLAAKVIAMTGTPHNAELSAKAAELWRTERAKSLGTPRPLPELVKAKKDDFSTLTDAAREYDLLRNYMEERSRHARIARTNSPLSR